MRDRLKPVPRGHRSATAFFNRGPWVLRTVLLIAGLAARGFAGAAGAEVTPRAIVIAPFDASSLAPDDQWMGEAVAQMIALGLTQQPGLVQIERARLEAEVDANVWTEAHVSQAGRGVHADAALYGTIGRQNTDLLLQPQWLDVKSGRTTTLPPARFADAELVTQLGLLSVAYARALRPTLTEGESARIAAAARPTVSLPALEFFTRAQMAAYDGRLDDAVALLLQTALADPRFVTAQYSLGVMHSLLGNRWKAAAQYRAASQLDPKMPEPFKALGDLYLSQPRKLFDQAIEAYSFAIQLRPFYADAYAGLGEARFATGDIDGALTAYQRAITLDPFKPGTRLRLGQIYAKKGLCDDAMNAYKQAGELDRRWVVVAAPCRPNSP
jgi:Flp pilus assembly protein TadD